MTNCSEIENFMPKIAFLARMRPFNNSGCRGKKLPSKGRHSYRYGHRNRDSHIETSFCIRLISPLPDGVPLEAKDKMKGAE
jgi:hypothetical protein